MNASLIERLRLLAKSSMGDDLTALLNDGLVRHGHSLLAADEPRDLYRAQGATQAITDLLNFFDSLKTSDRAPDNGDNPVGDNPIQE
jgi:hypothetical protein